jgi:hypothetical protein
MAKLISSIVAIVLATATLATAAPRQNAVRKSGTAARAKTVKPSKPATRKARKAVPAKYRRTTTAPKPATIAPSTLARNTVAQNPIARPQTPAAAETIANSKHDVMAEEQALKRLKADIKTSEKAGDWRRLSRDRREMYRLEADVRADKADMKDDKRGAKYGVRKKSRIPFWGWWRS